MSSRLILQKIIESDESVAPDENTSMDLQNPEEVVQRPKEPVRKKKRANRIVGTVTKNKDTINAKLKLSAETGAIFAKLNSTVENNNSSKKLLQYVLDSSDSELRLEMNYKMCRNEVSPINDPNILDNYDGPVVSTFNWIPSSGDVLRPQLTGCIISNTAAEDDGNDTIDNSIEKDHENGIDIPFDLNATVEIIQEDNGFIDIGNDDIDSLTEDDQHAIELCNGLLRSAVIVTDMRPDTVSLDLEYSYRVLTDQFNRFWVGPSYWKFKKPRTNAVRNATGDKKKKTFKNKMEPIPFEQDYTDDIKFISTFFRSAGKLRKINIYKRWDTRKTKLPRDFNLARNRFLFCPLAPGASLQDITSISPQTIISEQDNKTIDYGEGFGNDGGYGNENVNRSEEDNLKRKENVSVTEIGTTFIGAPEQRRVVVIVSAIERAVTN